jgi:hypothetical protein
MVPFSRRLTDFPAKSCWKLRHTQYGSHFNDSFGATDRVSCIDLDLSKFYSSGDPPFRGVSPSPVFTAVV